MVNTSSWRNRDSPFGNCLTTHERIVGIGWLFILLNWDASLHLLLTIIDKVIVLLVLKISCADRCIIHLLLGDLILAHFWGKVACVTPRLSHLYSIHNWNIYYFKIQTRGKYCNCLKSMMNGSDNGTKYYFRIQTIIVFACWPYQLIVRHLPRLWWGRRHRQLRLCRLRWRNQLEAFWLRKQRQGSWALYSKQAHLFQVQGFLRWGVQNYIQPRTPSRQTLR